MNDHLSRRDVSRRTIVKGAAWSVPVVAATVAVPAYAASPDCAGTATVTANGSELTMQTVTLPACARTVTYVVAGGAGGAGDGTYSGAGSMLVGAFSVSGGETLTLYAGGGGRGRYWEPARATGFTNGGMGTIAYFPVEAKTVLSAGGGGASSAIVLGAPGGTPLLVAGGGGGGTEVTSWAQSGGSGALLLGAQPGWGGNAEPYQDNIGSGRMMGDKLAYPAGGPTPDPEPYLTEVANHGVSATLTTAGAGGQAVLSGTRPADGSCWPIGLSGLDADPTSGDGGDAPPAHGDVNPDDYYAQFGGGGGGGGGWRGGGGGASLWFVNQTGVGTGGGGGSGSNYYGGATPGNAVTIDTISLPYPSTVDLSNQPYGERLSGAQGMVTISWS